MGNLLLYLIPWEAKIKKIESQFRFFFNETGIAFVFEGSCSVVDSMFCQPYHNMFSRPIWLRRLFLLHVSPLDFLGQLHHHNLCGALYCNPRSTMWHVCDSRASIANGATQDVEDCRTESHCRSYSDRVGFWCELRILRFWVLWNSENLLCLLRKINLKYNFRATYEYRRSSTVRTVTRSTSCHLHSGYRSVTVYR